MPVRTWEASWGLEEGWEPRSRSRRGAAPLAAESIWERGWWGGGAKFKVTIVLWVGWAGGRSDFLACSGEQKAYPGEQVGFPLVPGVPESPARPWGLCRSLGWGPATPSLPWFFPVSGLCTRHFFLLAASNPFLQFFPLRSCQLSGPAQQGTDLRERCHRRIRKKKTQK